MQEKKSTKSERKERWWSECVIVSQTVSGCSVCDCPALQDPVKSYYWPPIRTRPPVGSTQLITPERRRAKEPVKQRATRNARVLMAPSPPPPPSPTLLTLFCFHSLHSAAIRPLFFSAYEGSVAAYRGKPWKLGGYFWQARLFSSSPCVYAGSVKASPGRVGGGKGKGKYGGRAWAQCRGDALNSLYLEITDGILMHSTMRKGPTWSRTLDARRQTWTSWDVTLGVRFSTQPHRVISTLVWITQMRRLQMWTLKKVLVRI